MKKVIVYGNTIISEMLFYDSYGDENFEIEAFAVDREYLNDDKFLGLPQIDIKIIEQLYSPNDYDLIAPFTGFRKIRDRERFYNSAKSKGYYLRNYISRKSDVSPDVVMGENNIVFAQAHIGVRGEMGNNNIFRQQAYIGHEFLIGDHNVFSPACNVAAQCKIGNLCFIGIGATIVERLAIADETLVGAASLVIRDTETSSKNVGNPSKVIGYHLENGIMIGARK